MSTNKIYQRLNAFLKRALPLKQYEEVLIYEACIIGPERGDKKFMFIILTRDAIYSTDNPPKTICEVVKFQDIVNVQLNIDPVEFLQGKEQENSQHCVIEFLSNSLTDNTNKINKMLSKTETSISQKNKTYTLSNEPITSRKSNLINTFLSKLNHRASRNNFENIFEPNKNNKKKNIINNVNLIRSSQKSILTSNNTIDNTVTGNISSIRDDNKAYTINQSEKASEPTGTIDIYTFIEESKLFYYLFTFWTNSKINLAKKQQDNKYTERADVYPKLMNDQLAEILEDVKLKIFKSNDCLEKHLMKLLKILSSNHRSKKYFWKDLQLLQFLVSNLCNVMNFHEDFHSCLSINDKYTDGQIRLIILLLNVISESFNESEYCLMRLELIKDDTRVISQISSILFIDLACDMNLFENFNQVSQTFIINFTIASTRLLFELLKFNKQLKLFVGEDLKNCEWIFKRSLNFKSLDQFLLRAVRILLSILTTCNEVEKISGDLSVVLYQVVSVVNAIISGNIMISGNRNISRNTTISVNKIISGNTMISETTTMSGNKMISGNTVISRNTMISENTTMSGNKMISGNTMISENTIISENTTISGNAIISENAIMSGNTSLLKFIRETFRIDFKYRIRMNEISQYIDQDCLIKSELIDLIRDVREKIISL